MTKNVFKTLASIAIGVFFITLAFGSEESDNSSKSKNQRQSTQEQSKEKQDEPKIDDSEFSIGDDTLLYSQTVEEEDPLFLI